VKSESKNQLAFNLEPSVGLERDPNERALRLRQVCHLTGLGRSMIYQMQAEGRFPQRISLASGLWDGWRAKCETGWRLELKPAVVTSVARIEVVGTSAAGDPPIPRKALVAKYIVR
jgi:prophage regulatory protein